ncbi:MAG: LuxR C-terminal-related transcriptional regulator [Actinoplanes sp.]
MVDSAGQSRAVRDSPLPAHRIRVAFRTTDPLTAAGLTAFLWRQPAVVVVPDTEGDPDVLIVFTDRLTKDDGEDLRRSMAGGETRVLLVGAQFADLDPAMITDCHIVGVLPRRVVTRERLLRSILRAAAEEVNLPRAQLARLLDEAESLNHTPGPPGSGAPPLIPREAEILRLIADGLGTTEIARKLQYSERTVKGILYGLTTRLNLRNRSHAVAYAIRHGLI